MLKTYACRYRLMLSIIGFLFLLIGNNLFGQTFSTQSSATFPQPAGSGRAVVGDFDNDNDADILYQTGGDGTAFQFARNNGNGTFTIQTQAASPFAGVTLVNNNGSNYHVADFDRDGDLDVWAGVNGATGSYYRNDGGVFTLQSSSTFPAAAVSGRVTAGDFDNDGDDDFIYQTAGDGSPFQYARCNGNGTFTILALSASPFAGLTLPNHNTFNYHIGDFDGDGDIDLWVGVNSTTGSYFRNDGATFSAQSSAAFPAPLGSGRVVVCDFDTDLDADILYQTGGNGTAWQYYKNNGNGTFTSLSQAASPFASVTLVDHTGTNYYVSDFDHDGDLDMWGAVNNSTGSFYRKDAAPPSLVSFTPVNNATGVSTTTNITYTFSESVVKNVGNLYVVRLSDNFIAETINVTSAQVTGSGTNWTINPSITLAGTTQYAFKSDAGTFKNAAGTVFGGVNLSTTQSFTTQAAVNSVSVPADGTYKTGDNLNFTVNWSAPVNITGTPFIPVTIGSTVRNATYLSGSGTAATIFRYTIVAGDADNNGIAVGSAITLNGGTIKDAAAVDADITLNSVPSTAAVLVDAVAPTVTSVNVPVNGNYKTGNNLNFTINWNKSVTVASATPYITLNIGGVSKNATYISGSGTSALLFRYVISSGDLDQNGIDLPPSITLNSATIKDAVGNNAVLTLNNVGATTGVLVDGVLPFVQSITRADADPTSAPVVNFTVTFSESVTGVDAADFTLATTGSVAGATIGTVSGSVNTYNVAVNTGSGVGNIGLNFVSNGTVTDAAGNATNTNFTGQTYSKTVAVPVCTNVHNTSTGLNYCTIQAAIDDPLTLNGHTITVSSGTYNEQVLVNKSLTINGIGVTRPIVDFTGTVSGKPTLFDISADEVTINNIQFNVDLSKLRSAIIASAAGIDNIAVTNNVIGAYGTPAGSYGERNAVSINYAAYRVATGGVNSITFTGNTVSGTGPTSYFRAGVAVDEGGGTFSNNSLQTINHDVQVRFGSNGNISLTNNHFNGGGVELAEQNAAAGTLTVSGNTFDGSFANSSAPGTAVLRLRNNQALRPTNVSGNTFLNHQWAVSLENYNTVTIDNNAFTPLAGSTTYRHIVVNTKSISTNSATIVQTPVDGTFTRNTFNGSGSLGGYALSFLNHDNDNATFGTFNIGTVGNENIFNANIANDIYLGDQTGPSSGATFPDYTSQIGSGAGAITTMACWSTNLDARNNFFEGQTGATATLAQNFAIEDKIVHKIDDGCLGFVLVKANNDFVTSSSFIAPATTVPSIQRGVDAASNGFTVNVSSGTYNETVSVNKNITLNGANVGVNAVTGSRNTETILTSTPSCISLSTGNTLTVDGFQFNGRSFVVGATSNSLTVNNCKITTDAPSGSNCIYVGQPFTNFTVQNNDIVMTGNCQATIQPVGNYSGSGPLNTVDISGNRFTTTVAASGDGVRPVAVNLADVQGNVSANNFDGVDIGVLVANGAGNLTIEKNTFNALVRSASDHTSNSFGAGVVLFQLTTTAPPINIINNYFQNSDVGVRTSATSDFSSHAINIHNNSFTNNQFYHLRNTAGAGTFDATCNWYGTVSSSDIAAKVQGSVTYTPYLTNGTDNAPATAGFQPVPNSCNGLSGDSDGDGVPDAEDCAPTDPNNTNKKPKLTATINNVTIVSNNDGVDDEGAFSVANTTNNIVFGPFTDQNGNTGPVKAYQTLALTNATTTMCGNCSALLTEFNGGVHSLTLIDPYTTGKLVMTYRTWIDDNNNGMIDPGECVSPDRVIYTITINAAPRTDFYVNDDVQGGDHYTTAIGSDATGTGSPSAPYRTITKALSVASAGNTIWVDAGSYKEEANINKSVTIKGSNAGTAGNAVRLAEAIVDGENATHAGFLVNANNVTVDGFEVTGGGGASYNSGVWFNATQSGVHLINNIITDNVIGVYAQSNGASFIKHNLLDGNNRPGAAGGAAIYTEFSNGLTIDSNEIKNHLNNSAVVFAANSASAHQNVVFTQNYLHNNNADNSMVYCVGVNTGNFNKNTITQPGTTAIKFAGACTSITVSNNFLDNNGTGVKTADDLYGFGANSAIQVHENSFTNNTIYAINNLETTHTINATCNWYGTTDAAVVATKVSGNVTYTPYLNNGTDNDGATPGFQPVPGSCINNPCDNDNTPPTIVSKDATIHTDGNGNAHVNPFDVIQSVTDNCKVDSATIMVSPSDFTCATPPGTDGVHQAYVAPASQGVQDYGGELGMEFSVNEPAGITISQLGAFDDKSDGLHGTQSGGGIRVGIFSKATQQLVAGLSAVVVTTDPLVNNYRFVNVAPVTLPVGDYVIVAKGYNANERNGNKYYGSPVATGDLDGGAISYIGTSRYGNDDPGTFGYPTHADFGPANQYLAGTFSYSKASGGGGGGNTHTVTITAKDTHGNMATATATVTVVCDGTGGDPCTNDQTPPTIVSKNATIHADGNGNASVQPSDVVQSFTDNCGVDNASLMVSPNQFTCSAGSGDGNHQAYVAPTNQGIQNYGGELGMEFRVNEPNGITISQLGAFDDKGDGLHGTQSGGGIRVGIFNKSTQQLVTGLDVTILSADPYVSNYRFKNVAPVTLPPGDYVIVAKGYSDNERNGNKFNGSPVANGDFDGGAISYIGTSRYGSDANAAAFDYPTHPDYGPANQYLAGTFSYSKAGSGGGSNTHIVTITGKDTHGNMATTTATVTVICDGSGNPCDNDHTPPTLTTKNITINADGNGNATIVPDDVIASLTDDCGVDNASKTVTPNQFTCSSGTGSSDGVHQAYVATTNQGKQGDYTGELGMDFSVNDPGGITISQLGAFDDNGDGINGTQSGGIRVAVFNKTTQQLVAGLNVLIVTSDPYVNNYRFKTLASAVTLPPGDYVIVAKGYNVNERNGNLLYGSPTAIGDLDAGAISYTGTSRYGDDNIATFGFPTHPDHGSANQYLAGTFVYTKAGSGGNTHTVTVTAKDVHGNLASATATVTVVCNQASTTIVAEKGVPATGDVEVNSSDVQLYPNPTKGRFNVRLYNLTAPKVTLQILTETGVQVTQKVVELSGRTASLMVPFDLSNKPAGMYLIRIISDQGTQIKKVIIER